MDNTLRRQQQQTHCQYNETVHQKEQLATRINVTKKMLTLFTFTFTKCKFNAITPTKRKSGFEQKPLRLRF